MSGRCSAGSEDSTRDSPGLGFDTRSSVSRILGDEGCSPSGSPVSQSTTTYEAFDWQSGGDVRLNFGTEPMLQKSQVPAELISSAADSHVKTSQSPADEPGLQAGERSSLFFEFMRIADELVPPGGYVLIENVPGLLSSQGGRDFAIVLATLAELGFHDLAWRVLDSRYFGVPQRRRRVFIVGRRASGRRCCEILLEPESGGWDSAAGGEAGAGVAFASLSGLGSGGPDDNDAQGGRLVPALTARAGNAQDDQQSQQLVVAPTLTSANDPSRSPQSMEITQQVQAILEAQIADTLTSGSHPGSNMPGRRREDDTNIVALSGMGDGSTIGTIKGFGERGWDNSAESADRLIAYPLARRGRDGGSELEVGEANIYNALRAGDGGSSRLNQVLTGTVRSHPRPGSNTSQEVLDGAAVRRLTPIECERLQGLPDNWTQVPDTAPDSRRYAGLGDAVTANVGHWIGHRLNLIETRYAENAA